MTGDYAWSKWTQSCASDSDGMCPDVGSVAVPSWAAARARGGGCSNDQLEFRRWFASGRIAVCAAERSPAQSDTARFGSAEAAPSPEMGEMVAVSPDRGGRRWRLLRVE